MQNGVEDPLLWRVSKQQGSNSSLPGFQSERSPVRSRDLVGCGARARAQAEQEQKGPQAAGLSCHVTSRTQLDYFGDKDLAETSDDGSESRVAELVVFLPIELTQRQRVSSNPQRAREAQHPHPHRNQHPQRDQHQHHVNERWLDANDEVVLRMAGN